MGRGLKSAFSFSDIYDYFIHGVRPSKQRTNQSVCVQDVGVIAADSVRQLAAG